VWLERSVCQTDKRETGTEMIQVFSTTFPLFRGCCLLKTYYRLVPALALFWR
jgi:hypothetical protein